MIADADAWSEPEEVLLGPVTRLILVHAHFLRFDLPLLSLALARCVDDKQKKIRMRDLVSAVMPEIKKMN